MQRNFWQLCVLACGLAAGCGTPAPEEGPAVKTVDTAGPVKAVDTAVDTTTVATAAKGTEKPVAAKASAESDEKVAILEPFTAPPLAELDAKTKWEAQPVNDLLKLQREQEAKTKPTATVAEALKLQNTSEANNAKILSALGRLPAKESDVDWDATINRHSPMDLKSTNPILVSSTTEMDVADLTGFQLFSYDRNFNAFASSDAVVSWQSSADHLLDKVVMRDDLTWSDGTPITAHDVAFTFQTILNPKVPIPAVRSGTDKLRWVEAYDGHTVVFFHKEALATNVWNIFFPVIPKHIYEKSLAEDLTLANSKYHVKYENAPICGGPYLMSKRVRGQEVVLTRREDWYMHKGKQVRAKPYFKEVRFRIIIDLNTALLAFKSGELDEFQLQPEQWVTQTGDNEFYERNTKVRGVEWTYFYFGWNEQTPFFSDIRVRKAMSYAYDYKEMLDKLNYGLYAPCNGCFNNASWMAPKPPPAPYTQNLDKAEELLDEADWKDHDGDGIRDKTINGQSVKFEFTILCSNAKERVAYCTLLKENLDRIGIICNVKPLEFTVLQEKTIKHEFQAHFGGWGTGSDPDTSSNIWVTGEGRNFDSYSNPEVDKLYLLGAKEFDRAKRAKIYGKIADLIYADQPVTFLYFRNGFYGMSKQLRGYVYSPRGPFSPGFSSIWKPKQ